MKELEKDVSMDLIIRLLCSFFTIWFGLSLIVPFIDKCKKEISMSLIDYLTH